LKARQREKKGKNKIEIDTAGPVEKISLSSLTDYSEHVGD